MARTVYLKPQSMDMPPQGDWSFTPIFRLFEDSTMAGLEAQLVAGAGVQGIDEPNRYVIEEIEYQVTLVKAMPLEMNYSCMVWASKAERI